MYLNGGNLTISGTSTWSGGTIYIDNSSTFTNASGTFSATTNDSIIRFISSNGTATFSNAGTFVKKTATGTTTIGSGVELHQQRHGGHPDWHLEHPGERDGYRRPWAASGTGILSLDSGTLTFNSARASRGRERFGSTAAYST